MSSLPAVIPSPQSMHVLEGQFVFTPATSIQAEGDALAVAERFAEFLRQGTSLPIPINQAGGAVIHLQLEDGLAEKLGKEGYTLHVTPTEVQIKAAAPAGLYYGTQTLRQLLPVEVETGASSASWSIPALEIEDWPRFSWRGFHLDVARHFFDVAFIKKFIDAMALQKLNVLHWHLTEDQGWRIEIKKYPKLTEIGSKRDASPLLDDIYHTDRTPYGGFYTQEDVKEIVAYASERFITVLPEIEMPGHAVAALASYPELGCIGQQYKVRKYWSIAEDVFCAGNEQTFTFLEDVLSEVMALFPSEYIHIGGDECPKIRWHACPKCQQRMQEEGLQEETELQSWFIRRIEKFLNERGRRLIGWDEILEGGLAPNATVMSWRGASGGIAAANAGHDVVMTPNTYCYFDYHQSNDRSQDPPAATYAPSINLEKVYHFNPTDGIPAEKHIHVLGGQGNIWTERINSEKQVEYMLYPRGFAMAESLWTAPPERDFASFKERVGKILPRWDALKINYRNPFTLPQ